MYGLPVVKEGRRDTMVFDVIFYAWVGDFGGGCAKFRVSGWETTGALVGTRLFETMVTSIILLIIGVLWSRTLFRR